ncbi:TetR/AcrR family transcriptional regulator [[Brevibacterium] frigoritolerans]|uniref:TetR/AcrR family transcriptional regulator n=1 Tax=Peribacillus frigoritolerans TaxID=450367 RepID=A0A941FP70_9BACI|nr:TetR/AcrR family transcriptional regulator [Peribacillus frigoritolerans]
MQKQDRRIDRTKTFLKDALLKLLSENPISKISITELCNEANINRGTFYAHYDN